MGDDVLRLFDEYAIQHCRGQEPDLRQYLARAGADAETFGNLVDAFLAGAEPPPAPAERVEAMRAWIRGEPPVLELRKQRRLKRPELVARLTALLGLKPDREAKVGDYYHRLETGLLDTRRVDTRVWDALRELLGADVRALARWRPPPAPAAPAAMYRVVAERRASPMAASMSRREMPEEDEVDLLFRGGS